ncbi:transcriptional repressor LexA [Usitatibacter palustris]|uniref:LexA repressor n=1 Tax=Usitatibacter palustris TaxID=2732487 RepID=A0A6M4H8F4_9PROT|nr:transcriptional repressor LexA [Usitatibacter palustris]QJR15108.1 LexA repressor [Usitatibacter palustris]
METPVLTARQAEILDIIRRHIAETGVPPSRPELSKMLGIASTNGVFKHLAALAKKGAIELVPNSARGIRLVVEEAGLALIGNVAAGSPMMAIENMLGRYPVDPSLFSPRADYLLQVRGLSMKDEGILDGDWLVVHKTNAAKSGQLVVARLGDDVTVKRLKIRGDKAELIPANKDFQTLHLDLKRHTLHIEGIGVGVIRNLGARAH